MDAGSLKRLRSVYVVYIQVKLTTLAFLRFILKKPQRLIYRCCRINEMVSALANPLRASRPPCARSLQTLNRVAERVFKMTFCGTRRSHVFELLPESKNSLEKARFRHMPVWRNSQNHRENAFFLLS